MLPQESRELKPEWARRLVQKFLNPKGKIYSRPLRTNNYERHKNWKIVVEGKAYLLRVENPFTNKIRRMFLKDEIAVLKMLAPYRVTPRFIAHGRYDGRLFLIEEWISAPRLDAIGHLTNMHYRKIIEFMARMNNIPLAQLLRQEGAGVVKLLRTPLRKEARQEDSMTRHTTPARLLFKFKNDRLDRLAARRRDLEARIRAGHAIKKFRPLIKEMLPIFKSGFMELARRVRTLPESVWQKPVLSYRDISHTNIFTAKPHYLAVDWEWHSVGIADPSLSLVVLMQRFNLLPKRKWILNEYRRLCPTPHLEELVDARILERLLGGLTWSLGWVANMKRVGVPQKDLRRAVKGGIQNIRARRKELTQFFRDSESTKNRGA